MRASDFINEATFDPHGWGSTPDGLEIDYFGLRVQMKPSLFLKLALPLGDAETNPKVEKHMQSGGKIAPPMLYVEIPDEWTEGDYSKRARVVNHEGRNRMRTWINLHGDDPVQVNLKPRGWLRRKHLTDEIIDELQKGLVSERGTYISGPLFDRSTVLESTINESLSRVAYHYTGIKPALKILTDGNFELSSVFGSIEEKYAPKGHPYFLSTTRTRHGGYHDIVGSGAVLFVLDGDWFNQHYISKPVDYWENRDPTKSHHRAHEAEDRVFSKNSTIPIGGVRAIHVYIKDDADDVVKAMARRLLITAKNLGIQTNLYNDVKAWKNFDPRQEKRGAVGKLTGINTLKGYVSTHEGWLKPWMELIFAKDRAALSKKANDIRYGLAYTYNKQDIVRGLKNEFSNARKPDAGRDREYAVKIIDYMRRAGIKSLTDLVDNLANKWKQ